MRVPASAALMTSGLVRLVRTNVVKPADWLVPKTSARWVWRTHCELQTLVMFLQGALRRRERGSVWLCQHVLAIVDRYESM
jgi:hypothetical protein